MTRSNMLKALCVAAICFVAARASLAHHSFSAQYDANRPATIEGMVTKFEWNNPHVYFYMDVFDADGNVTNWELEMSNTLVLLDRGWNRNTLKIGDLLVVEGALARDNSPLINVRSIVRQDSGEKIF